MTYEEKREKIAFALLEAEKFALVDEEPILYTEDEVIKAIPFRDIYKIMQKFEQEKLVEIIQYPTDLDEQMLNSKRDTSKEFIFRVTNKQKLKEIIPTEPMMKVISDMQDRITGKTAEQRARIRAIEKAEEAKAKEAHNNFFIEYNADRVIRLNGKIDLGRPQFGTDAEAIWRYLYSNPNKVFTYKEIEEATNVEVTDRLDKVVERWGFYKGLKSAFFDISNAKGKESVKFKNPVTL